VQDLSKTDKSIGRGPGTQRESPKVRGISGHIEQAGRGAIRESPQEHKHFAHFYPPVFVSYGFVLVQVQVQVFIYFPKAKGVYGAALICVFTAMKICVAFTSAPLA
jgi:hypothetical protein